MVGGHLPFNKMFGVLDTAQSEPSAKVGSGKCLTLHVPFDSQCICLIFLKCQTISKDTTKTRCADRLESGAGHTKEAL